MDEKFRSRKFALAVSSLLVASVALFMNIITGNEWVASVAVVLGGYGFANVMEKK